MNLLFGAALQALEGPNFFLRSFNLFSIGVIRRGSTLGASRPAPKPDSNNLGHCRTVARVQLLASSTGARTALQNCMG